MIAVMMGLIIYLPIFMQKQHGQAKAARHFFLIFFAEVRAGGPGSFLQHGPLAARDTGPATGRAAFRAARRSAKQLLELYTIRSDGLLDGRLEDRYERIDPMGSYMFLI